jgi:hypothetical protein
MLENIQEIINELHRMKKEYNAPQGCSVRIQERNGYRSKCLSIAIKALSEVQTLAKAKADGRLVVLPCKVGDTVYAVYGYLNKSIGTAIVKQICVRDNEIRVVLNNSIEKIWGRSVFATQEEAEKALEVGE